MTDTPARLPLEIPAPGKLILFGEHATVYGHPGIAAPVDIGMRITVRRDPGGPRLVRPHFQQLFGEREPEGAFETLSRAVDKGLEIHGLENAPIAIEVTADLPVGMGLGSSAAFSAGICKALRRYAGHDAAGTDLFDHVQRLESIFHGTPSGLDAATVLADSVLWYRKGPPPEIRPMLVPTPPAGLICIGEPGASTLAQVEMVRRRLADDEERVRGLLDGIGGIVRQARDLLGNGDMAGTGELMDRNHELLTQLGVSTGKLDRAVALLQQEDGILGAKLTGAGGGGAVIALTTPKEQQPLVERLSDRFPLVVPFSAVHVRP
jgi:mevalonate kinase